jgi:peptidyl-prolyl cis-trans isomerase A (cyclophilin A)
MLDRTLLILLSFGLAAAGQTTPPAPTHGTHTPPTTLSKTAPAAAQPEAILHTTAGDMKCELFPAQAPKAVANFIGLAKGTKPWKDPVTSRQVTGKPLYDGVTFHRVIPAFMIQAGDPSGTGSGDVGIEFGVELHSDLIFDKPGRLAMANASNINSSQFFITEAPVPYLDPCLDESGCPKPYPPGHVAKGTGYTIFGQCDDATVELVKKISRMPCTQGPVCTQTNSRLQTPVKITHIEIVKPGAAAKPSAGKSTAKATPQPKPKPTPVAQ